MSWKPECRPERLLHRLSCIQVIILYQRENVSDFVGAKMAHFTSIVKYSDVSFICVYRKRLTEIFIEEQNSRKEKDNHSIKVHIFRLKKLQIHQF